MDQLWVNVLARCPAYTNVEESIKRELTVIMVPRFHSSKIKSKHLKDKTSWLSFEDMFQMFQYLYNYALFLLTKHKFKMTGNWPSSTFQPHGLIQC